MPSSGRRKLEVNTQKHQKGQESAARGDGDGQQKAADPGGVELLGGMKLETVQWKFSMVVVLKMYSSSATVSRYSSV